MKIKENKFVLLPGAKTNPQPQCINGVYILPSLDASPTTSAQRLDAEIEDSLFKEDSEKQSEALKTLEKADSLEIHEPTGRGGYATIYRASFEKRTVAAKILHGDATTKTVEALKKEADLHRQVDSVYVLKAYGCFISPCDRPALLVEYVPKNELELNNLEALLKKSTVTLSWNQQWQISWEVSSGLQALHSADIIHADLTPSNVLVYRDTDASTLWHIKICDLGLSHKKNESGSWFTALWGAPERLNAGKGCSTIASDIYSLGVLLWQVISREEPYEGYQNIHHFTREMLRGKQNQDGTTVFPIRPAISKEFSQQQPRYAHLIEFCWQQDPKDRPENMETIINTLEEIKPKP